MKPIEVALKIYRDLSPMSYLERTHDAKIYDISFDGEELMLASEAWVATDPLDPTAGRGFLVIFSRYRATFSKVNKFRLEMLNGPPGSAVLTLHDFMRGKIRELTITLPNVIIGTDEHELAFTCRSFDIDRFAPTEDDYR